MLLSSSYLSQAVQAFEQIVVVAFPLQDDRILLFAHFDAGHFSQLRRFQLSIL